MTSGIGNPDWQRRYSFSAVPLYSASFAAAGTVTSPVVDANGYQYIMLTAQMSGTTSFTHIFVVWYQDSAGTIQIGGTDFMSVPGSSLTIKVPAAARYFRIQTVNVGGGNTGNFLILTYGSNADQDDTLTGQTSVPILYINASLGSGVIQQTTAAATFGGLATISVDQNFNTSWTAWAEYYDWSAAAWKQYVTWHGASKGQSFVDQVRLPYCPVRLNVRNDDTVARTMIASVVGA